MTELVKNYEPKPHERIWYRSQANGDLGYYCRVGGVDHIRLNRPGLPDTQGLKKFNGGAGWTKEAEHRPLTAHQLAHVAFAADAALCRYLGLHNLAGREWAALRDEDRIEWTENGPQKEAARIRLHNAIKDALQEFTK